ncbi:hypothetical protein YTPLAS18_15750 [Nitrospira sp.]|nr:hypothetical protein YTPLAS18_15750 [Nitrospira sp.]
MSSLGRTCVVRAVILALLMLWSPALAAHAARHDARAGDVEAYRVDVTQASEPAPRKDQPESSIDPGIVHEPDVEPLPGAVVTPPVTDPEMAIDPRDEAPLNDAPSPEPIPDPVPVPVPPSPTPAPDPPKPHPPSVP